MTNVSKLSTKLLHCQRSYRGTDIPVVFFSNRPYPFTDPNTLKKFIVHSFIMTSVYFGKYRPENLMVSIWMMEGIEEIKHNVIDISGGKCQANCS